jgi:DNA-binding MarR family transcriptional regulator
VETYEDCILFLLAKAYQKAYGNFKKRLQPFGLTPSQNLVLMALFLEEKLSAGEIAKRLTLDNATLSGVLDRLAEAGWVIKGTADNDKRFLQISLTPKAMEIKDKLMRERDDANADILSDLRLEERWLLKRLLKDLKA